VLQKLSEDDAGVVHVESISPPDWLAVDGANPFTEDVSIRFEVPAAGRVSLTVFDVTGRRVATLADGQVSAGLHRATWDRRSSGGDDVISGVYFIKCEAAGRSAVEKVLVLR
jgi:flagellar hook assembly protein FlgD